MDVNVVWVLLNTIVLIGKSMCQIRELAMCHDDFSLNPPDGVLSNPNAFTWIAYVQYLHEKLSTPHSSLAPRVVLIHKQFVLGTAKSLLHPPKDYVVDTIIFGRYERDGDNCGFKQSDFRLGKSCPPATLEIPPANIIAHPEFSRFEVGNSLALVKLIRPLLSEYMIPICLPTLHERSKLQKKRSVFLVDYNSVVPSNFDFETMAKITYELHTDEECSEKIVSSQNDTEKLSNMLCTSGCGVRLGTPIVSHAASGPFELIGIATQSGLCTSKSMRYEYNTNPPRYIDVYPYVSWITSVISAHVIPKPFPHRLMAREEVIEDPHKDIIGLRQNIEPVGMWIKNIYLFGDCCKIKNAEIQGDKPPTAAFFYAESFFVNSSMSTKLKVFLKVSGGVECKICCLKMKLPNKKEKPVIRGIRSFIVDLQISTDWFPEYFGFTLAMMGSQVIYNFELGENLAKMGSTYWLDIYHQG